MRARNLKPSFFSNEKLAECSFEARLFFAGLWCVADKNGVIENRPKRLRGEIFPHDVNVKVEALIDQLENVGLIVKYESDGRPLIFISGWEQHANPHWKEPAKFPLPEKAQTSPGKSGQVQTSPGQVVNGNQPCALNPSSGIPLPESGIPLPEGAVANSENSKVEIGYPPNAEGCAQAWVATLKRIPKADDTTHGSLEAFREFIRLGVDPVRLLEEILSKTRDRTEYLWQFKKRVVSKSREPTQTETGFQRAMREDRERRERERGGRI